MWKQSLEFKCILVKIQFKKAVKMEPGHTGEVRRDTLDGDIQLSGDGLKFALLRSDEKDRADSMSNTGLHFTTKQQKEHGDSLPDVSQQLDEVIGGDFAAVLSVQRRKLAVHVQAALGIFEHLSGKAKSQLRDASCYYDILRNVAHFLTWPPRQRASCTDPGADTSVWRF